MTKVHLQREPTRYPTNRGVTLGSLYINGVWVCWALEDAVREVAGRPVVEWKVPGMTAIPAGTYSIITTLSQRFGRMLPLLVDVPGFDGVRIHPGNTEADTSGCILLGLARGDTSIGGSVQACNLVQPQLAVQPVTIGIRPALQ